MAYEYTLDDGAASGVGGGSAAFGNVLTLVNDACEQLGLGTQTVVYASTDPNVVQIRALLKQEGRRLLMERAWLQLVTEHTFSTVAATASYALPGDFSRMVNQTAWNQTADRRFVPLGGQAWQYLKTTGNAPTLHALFRPRSGTFEIYPTPTAAETVVFEYLSQYWVASSGSATADKDAPTADTDTVLFDPTLMVCALKLAFLKAKGFDATSAAGDYARAYALACSANVGAAPVLSLNGGSVASLGANVADGSWDL